MQIFKMACSGLAGAMLALLPLASSAQAAGSDYPTFAFDAQRSGVNPNETSINGATVAGLHKIWTAQLDHTADSSAIFLAGVSTSGGDTHDLVYVTTKRGVTAAFDAHSGQQVWKTAPSTGSLASYQITTSTPVASPDRQWIYAASPDGKVHRYAAGSGQETVNGVWPVTVTVMPDVEKISSALNLANNHLYVTTSGYNGDFGPYDGHLVAVDLSSGATSVFNSLCSDVHQLIGRASAGANTCGVRESGIWARGGAVVDQSGGPSSNVVYFATGNGPFNGSTLFGDSVLAVSPDAGTLFGFYTPSNFAELDQTDTDLGSMAPAPLPQQPTSRSPWMSVIGGKDGVLRLINRAQMGGLGADLSDLQIGAGQLLPAPVIWKDGAGVTWIFVAADGGLTGVKVQTDGAGVSSLQRGWAVHPGGTSPVMAGNVLFMAGHDGAIHAYDPESGAELWNTGLPWAGGGVGSLHWESPIATGGMLFLPDEQGRLIAYGL